MKSLILFPLLLFSCLTLIHSDPTKTHKKEAQTHFKKAESGLLEESLPNAVNLAAAAAATTTASNTATTAAKNTSAAGSDSTPASSGSTSSEADSGDSSSSSSSSVWEYGTCILSTCFLVVVLIYSCYTCAQFCKGSSSRHGGGKGSIPTGQFGNQDYDPYAAQAGGYEYGAQAGYDYRERPPF